MTKVLITGATGNIGLETIKSIAKLQNPGIELIAGVRNIEKAKNEINVENLNFCEFDFFDASDFERCLDGVDKIFLIRPPGISEVKAFIFPFIDKAKEKGVSHIVFLSLLGAQFIFFAPHFRIEKYLKKLGVNYTFLRAGFFMQNLNTIHCSDIVKNNQLLLPAGKGKTSFIDVRDIADIAALTLLNDGHTNKAYDLTGEEALDYYKVSQLLSKTLNKKIEYKASSIRYFRKHMQTEGFQNDFINVMIGIYSVVRLGFAKKVTSEVEFLLGRKPISFKQYITDYKSFWDGANQVCGQVE